MKRTIINLYCALLVIAGLSASCKKNISADIQEQGVEALSGITPVPPYTWSQLAIPGDGNSYPFNQPHAPVLTVPVGDTYYCWTGASLEKLYVFNKTTKRWQAMADYHVVSYECSEPKWLDELEGLYKKAGLTMIQQ